MDPTGHASNGPGRLISDEALLEYCDRNYHQILPIVAEKVHQEKEHPSKEGVSRKGSDQDMSATDPEVLSQGVTAPNHLRKRVRKEKQCSKGVGHTTVAAETLKVATKALVREQWSPLPRGVIPREHPQEEWRSCKKVKAAWEVIGSKN
ncbi:hypothetical protein Tco_0234243 [Tanacetum coccineum]